MAARLGHLEMVDALVRAKASKQLRDKTGHTPIELAKAYHHGPVVKRLSPKKKATPPATKVSVIQGG